MEDTSSEEGLPEDNVVTSSNAGSLDAGVGIIALTCETLFLDVVERVRVVCRRHDYLIVRFLIGDLLNIRPDMLAAGLREVGRIRRGGVILICGEVGP